MNIPAETVVGDRGEFTVWLNDRQVLSKGFLLLPSPKKIVQTLRAELPKK